MGKAVQVPSSAVAPALSRAPARMRANRSDQEFLPAALEILERPPSPIGVALMAAIGLLVVAALAWSYFGHIDIIAVAQGKIQPAGRVKLIQPLETGKVARMLVENGQHVSAGEVLVELDSADAGADESAALASMVSYRAEALRRRAAIAVAESGALKTPPAIDWARADAAGAVPDYARRREERVLSGDLGQLAANVGQLRAQQEQKRAERDSLAATIAAEERLIAVLQQRVTMRESLVVKEAGTRSSVIDAKELYETQQTTLATQKGQLASAIAAIEVAEKDIARALGQFIAENAQKLADAERQADDYQQRLAKARAKMHNMTLTSPISGVVQASSVTTIGQVVQTSEELMRVVPDGGAVEIEAYLANKDIGFVKVGQDAVVKVESFPFTRYGGIAAKVVRVATDAIPEPDAAIAEGNPARSTKSTGFAGAQRTQNLVFPIVVRMDRSEIAVDGAMVPLSPGMAVSVEVQTGSRRILEYVFSPLVVVGSEAMRER